MNTEEVRLECPGSGPHGMNCRASSTVEEAYRAGRAGGAVNVQCPPSYREPAERESTPIRTSLPTEPFIPLNFGDKDDPFPGPTGSGTEDIRSAISWFERRGVPTSVFESHHRVPSGEDIARKAKAVRLEAGTGVGEPDPEDLRDWWVKTATEDILSSLSKIREYGGSDLLMMGQALARIGNLEVDDQGAQELGCWIYLEGKLARAISALTDRRRPSDDTILDIVFYAMMLRRIRKTGRWP